MISEWHLGRGLKAARKGDWNSALAHYQQAESVRPDDFGIHLHLAIALKRRGKLDELDEAEKHLQQAVSLDATNPALHVVCGRLYYELDELRKAEEHFQQTLRFCPENAVAASWLALIYLEEEKLNEGLHMLRVYPLADDEALIARLLCTLESKAAASPPSPHSLAPSLPCSPAPSLPCLLASLPLLYGLLAPLFGLFYRWRGISFLYAQKIEKALKLLQTAAALRPNDEGVKLSLVAAYLEADRPDAALKALEQVSDSHWDYPFYMGAALAEVGKAEEAVGWLEKADEFSPLTHYYRGIAFLLGGDTAKALDHFARTYRMDPALVRMRIEELVSQLSS